MLKGPRDVTPQGRQCAFCGILNPEDAHLQEHNAQSCHQGPPDSFKSKRRHELVCHLRKIHGIENKFHGEAIAVKWKSTVEKQTWSCGFCVSTFPSFNEHLGHIASEHFERGQKIDDWDATKVIQGLLQQPGVIEAWKEKMMTWQVENTTWEKHAIIDLQHDLEVGPNDEKSAVDLAEAAFIACRLTWDMDKDMEGVMAISGANFDQTLGPTPNQIQPSSASSPYFSSDHRHSLAAVQHFNDMSSSRLGTLANPPLDYSYSDIPIANYHDSSDEGRNFPPFGLQQSHSATSLREHNDEEGTEDENDIEEDADWPRFSGMNDETDSDILVR